MATQRQKQTAKLFVENHGKSISKAMRDAGYSAVTARNPKNLTNSKSWQELLDEYLPEKDLTEVHRGLLKAQRLEHMVFPHGIEEETIKELLNSVGCTPRKIKYGDTSVHVWFWSPDSKTRKDAVELAYKIRGRIKTTLGDDPDNPLPQLVIVRAATETEAKGKSKPKAGEGRTIKI